MELAGVTINDCYLLKSKLDEDEAFEYWIAHAIYSPSNFVLLLAKKTVADINPEFFEEIKNFSASLAKIKTRAFEVFIELGQYENHIFMVFLQIQGTALSEARYAGPIVGYPDAVSLVIELAESLRMLEMEGISHGWICPENVWLLSQSGNNLKAREVYGSGISCLYENKDPRQIKYRKYYPQNISLGSAFQRDVYGLGMTFVILLHGNSMFMEENRRRLIGNDFLIGLSIPESGKKLISDLLEVHTKYESMQDVLLDLNNLLPETTRLILDYKQLRNLTGAQKPQLDKNQNPLSAVDIELNADKESMMTVPDKTKVAGVLTKAVDFIKNFFGLFGKRKDRVGHAQLEAVLEETGESHLVEELVELDAVEEATGQGARSTLISGIKEKDHDSFLNVIKRKFEDYFLGDREQVDWEKRQQIKARKMQYLLRKRNRNSSQKPGLESMATTTSVGQPGSSVAQKYPDIQRMASLTQEKPSSIEVPENQSIANPADRIVPPDHDAIQKEFIGIHHTIQDKQGNAEVAADPDFSVPLPQNAPKAAKPKSWWTIFLEVLKSLITFFSKRR